MSKIINHKMVKLEDVLQVLENARKNPDCDPDVVDHIERQILNLITKPRLVLINGGKND